MTLYILVFAAALVLVVGATPLARRLAPRLGMMDQPSARKVHHQPVPRIGGVAIYLAVLAASVALAQWSSITYAQIGSIVVGATGISFLGLVDDRWGLRPVIKIIGQVLAALLLYATGIYVGTFPFPALNLVVTIFWVGYITNGLNLLDNMDGLAGGVAAIGAAYFALMCASNGQYLVGALSIAVLGACLGFLFYNLNPASIFMGDAGSLFLGFILSAVAIKLRFPEGIQIVTWMVPVLILGLPLFDTTLVIVSRLRRHLNPLTTPGRDHLSHRLVALGYTRREAVLICYLICAGLGVIALFVTEATIVEGYVVGGCVALIAVAALWRLEQVDFPGKDVQGTFLRRRN